MRCAAEYSQRVDDPDKDFYENQCQRATQSDQPGPQEERPWTAPVRVAAQCILAHVLGCSLLQISCHTSNTVPSTYGVQVGTVYRTCLV